MRLFTLLNLVVAQLSLHLVQVSGGVRQYSWRINPSSSSWRFSSLDSGSPTSPLRYSRKVAPGSPPASGKREVNYWNYFDNGQTQACEYACDDGTCLQEDYICDGYAHCWDGSDERNCSCSQLIAQQKICDGIKDCPDGRDEVECVYGCGISEFTCDTRNTGSKVRCIDMTKRCDGSQDCPQGNDEEDCFRLVDLTDPKSRGVRSKGILQKRVADTWHTVCKTASASHYLKAFAGKTCQHVVGNYNEGEVKTTAVSLVNLKKQMTTEEVEALRYIRLQSTESKFTVLGACPSAYVYEVECPQPQCGGTGNADLYDRRRRRDAYREEPEPEEDEEDESADGYGENEESEGEMIVGGYDAADLGWPYLVGIFRDGEFYCGGSIVNDRWILTAAHCCHGYDKHVFEVQAGMTRRYSWSPYEQTRAVLEIYVHEAYDHKIFANDIALFKLDKPLYLSRYVTPACLPSGNQDDPSAGDYCRVAGWGDLHESGTGPDHMQEVALPVLSRCLETFTRDTYQICAGILEGGKDACQGDSGGPLMCLSSTGKPIVNGVVSFGRGCARENEAGAYTRVSAYRDWMETIIDGGYTQSTYHARPKQCSEKCYKSGGECLYPEEKCTGKVDCLDGQDELSCSASYISRSHQRPDTSQSNYWSKYGQQSYYHQGRVQKPGGGGAPRPPSNPPIHYSTSSFPHARAQQYNEPSSRPDVSGTVSSTRALRRTTRACENEEIQCGQEDGEGVKECIMRAAFCDGVPNCSNDFDEVNCFAITRDFRQPLGQTFQASANGEVKGYVLARSQGLDWHPLIVTAWTLDLGQFVCDRITQSASGITLLSLETIQLGELAKRLPPSAVNLLQTTLLRLSDNDVVTYYRKGGAYQALLSLTRVEGANNQSADLGYVRCTSRI